MEHPIQTYTATGTGGDYDACHDEAGEDCALKDVGLTQVLQFLPVPTVLAAVQQ